MLYVSWTLGSIPGYATSQLLTLKKNPLNCSSLKEMVPPSTHSACICEVRADLSRSSKSRKGAIIRHGSPAASFTKTDGKSPGILDIPPHPPSSNAGNLVHYLQQTQWDHFLNETPLQSQILSQRLSFQALPPSPHSSLSEPDIYTTYYNCLCKAHQWHIDGSTQVPLPWFLSTFHSFSFPSWFLWLSPYSEADLSPLLHSICSSRSLRTTSLIPTSLDICSHSTWELVGIFIWVLCH